jgi:hypothetical protein
VHFVLFRQKAEMNFHSSVDRVGLVNRLETKAMSRLVQSLQKGFLGGLTATALLNGIAIAHPSPEPHPHVLQTRTAAFLRDCGFQTPASVQSVSRECPNIERGLVGTGSSVEILSTVNRDRSGLRGMWYEVRIVQNKASGGASVNAQSGIIGWLRGW